MTIHTLTYPTLAQAKDIADSMSSDRVKAKAAREGVELELVKVAGGWAVEARKGGELAMIVNYVVG